MTEFREKGAEEVGAASGNHAASATSSVTQPLFYLYCVVESGTKAHEVLRENQIPGLEPDQPLFPVEAAGLAAAVSRVPSEIFQDESFNQLLTELPRLAPFALRHNEAIRALLPLAPAVIPISMGAVYRSHQGIVSLLQDRAQLFHDLLASLHGKQEWEVKVLKDRAQLREAAGDNSDQLRRLAQEESQSSPGRAYLLRKQRERLLLSEADRLERLWLDAIMQSLTEASAAAHADQLPEPQTGAALSLVMKVSFLVESGATEDFHSLVAQLGEDHAPRGLRLEISGPWPPYSFVRERMGAR